MKIVSIVSPIYNEQESVNAFYESLTRTINDLPYTFEILLVNDGSSDDTETILNQIADRDSRVRAIHLSRNFGHQAALSAGLAAASGDYTVMLDSDGQHPVELIPELLELAESGYDIVQTQRLDDGESGSFKRATSALFYRFLNKLSDTATVAGGADFRLMNRRALDALVALPEFHRYLRGMVSWIGFRSVILPFTVKKRIAGRSKYSLKKMFRLGSDAIFSFSMVPLYVGLSGGGLFLILALIEVIYVLSFWFSGNSDQLAPGWSSLMFMLLIVAAILMFILGFIGVYVGYIFQEVKGRPVYIVREVHAQEPSEDASPDSLHSAAFQSVPVLNRQPNSEPTERKPLS